MRRLIPVVPLAACCLSLGAWGHLCNNIYRTPDRVIVKPEKQVTTVDQSERFRVFVQNNYPTRLTKLRLGAQAGGGIQVAIEPAEFAQLKAGERVAFTLNLTVPPGTPRGTQTLRMAVAANEIGFRPAEQPTVAQLRQAAGDDNSSPKVLAAESLMRLGDPTGTQVLTQMASAGDRDYGTRALRAIGKSGDKNQIPFLRSALRSRDGSLRGTALLSLGLLGDGKSTFVAMAADRDEYVKACAWAGWYLSGEHSKAVEDAVRGGLTSDNVYVRIASGWALASNRDIAGIKALDEAFATDDVMQRVSAGDAMVDIANRPNQDPPK
ncbi:MAG: hypothetical protein HZB16_10775 [Armatimonadetes bacterium]|nr:hypothetical protein [Armatimonadota bacterium]